MESKKGRQGGVMARYIDVDIAVREAINACNKLFREKGEFLTSLDAVEIAEALDDITAADVVEIKHGEWILSSDGYYPFCSNCRYEPPFVGGKDMRTPCCPNCGAKMDGGRKNDGKG